MMRILIAGVGNVLRGDDAFGIEALCLLQQKIHIAGVEFFESGIAGISLVQRLMDDFDALIIIDALDRGGDPGQIYVIEPELESLGGEKASDDAVDLHQADPERVLRLASALRVLPKHVWIVGCQAVGCDDLDAPLSEPVAHALPVAVEHVRKIVENLIINPACHVAT
jgi:hydrogenase maturation protease